MSRIEDQYADVLQNIEFAIVTTYKDYPDLTDYAVMRILEALLKTYEDEKAGRPPRTVRLSELEQLLLEQVYKTCEWRLGRGTAGDEQDGTTDVAPITTEVMILCLKRILKSVNRWNKSGGRQGYLKFIIQFVG